MMPRPRAPYGKQNSIDIALPRREGFSVFVTGCDPVKFMQRDVRMVLHVPQYPSELAAN